VLDRTDGQRAQKVAQYVAKYATKSSAESGALDCRITSEEDLSRRALSPHVRRMAEVAWTLGANERFAHLHLRRHAHSLGYADTSCPNPVVIPRASVRSRPTGWPGAADNDMVSQPPTIL
jgi:hypothetical protein